MNTLLGFMGIGPIELMIIFFPFVVIAICYLISRYMAKFEPNFSKSSDISTQIIETNASVDDVLLAVKETFSHLARSVELSPHSFQTNQLLHGSYGSKLTNNATQFTFKRKTKGFLITAKTVFGPSLWVFILGLFFICTLVMPIIMYFLYHHQKHNVRNTIENGLKAISDQLKT